MSKTQSILAGVMLVVLAVFGETLILKGETQSAMTIATGVIGALNLGGLAAQIIKAPSA